MLSWTAFPKKPHTRLRRLAIGLPDPVSSLLLVELEKTLIE